MGLNVENLVKTQPSTYQLFKILFCMQHEKSNSAQSREALTHTVNSIREKQ